MKVTAQISRGGNGYYGETRSVFQLEATAEELAALMGYSQSGSEKARDHAGRFTKRSRDPEGNEIFSVGDEIDVSKMWKTLHDIRKQGPEVLEYSAKLKAAAALLDSLPKTLQEIHVSPNPLDEGGES